MNGNQNDFEAGSISFEEYQAQTKARLAEEEARQTALKEALRIPEEVLTMPFFQILTQCQNAGLVPRNLDDAFFDQLRRKIDMAVDQRQGAFCRGWNSIGKHQRDLLRLEQYCHGKY